MIGGDQLFMGSSQLSGLPSISVSGSLGADGTVSILDNEGLSRCSAGTAPDAVPATSVTCSMFGDSGVAMSVRDTVTGDGHIVRQLLAFSSTNGEPHQLTIAVSQYGESQGPAPQWSFPPATSTFSTHSPGDAETPAAAPASVLVGPHGAGTGVTSGEAGITYAVTPDSMAFTTGNHLTMRYAINVPATGLARLGFVFATEGLAATVATDDTAAAASFHPTVTLDHPLAATTTVTTPAVVVSGTASDLDGPVSVTINGVAVTTDDTAAFGTALALRPGANTITVSAVNSYGFATTVTRTVTYAKPKSRGGAGRLALNGKLRARGYTKILVPLKCTGMTACAGSVTATTSVRAGRHRHRTVAIGSAKVSIKAGRHATVTITLGRTAKKLLARRHAKLTAKVTITQKGIRKALATKSLTLKHT
jgi:hypothetical protein